MILLIDFETTGLDPKDHRVIEIGAMICQEDWTPVGSLSVLVKGEDYPPLTAEITKITGITEEDMRDAVSPEIAWKYLSDLCGDDVSYVVAFNSNFDSKFFQEEMKRTGFSMLPRLNKLLQLPWLCAMADVETNYQYKSWRLSHLALEYGVPVNPKELHRAVNDVKLMRDMLEATGTNIAEIYEFNVTPWIFIRAIIPPPWDDGGAGKKAAQELGYSWEVAKGTDGPRFEKAWVKRIKESKFQEEESKAGFKIRMIKENAC